MSVVPTIVVLILIIGVVLWIGAMVSAASTRKSKYNRICPGQDCGHVNPKRARYCARCGRELTAPGDRTDAG
jgi:hypothetical protein